MEMITNKQDRQGVRTAADLERKYDLAAIIGLKTAVKNSIEGLNKTNSVLENFVIATLESIDELQKQIDGNITTWFYEGIPELSNLPASEWTTDEQKASHIGDLYYDKDTGYAYRFTLSDDMYMWLKLSDSDVVEALALANAASDTADSKRRVFTETPNPPYDNGDLWFNKQEIYICQISKDKYEIYEEKDFIIATKYTDDTIAIKVGNELTVVKGTVTEIKEGFNIFKVEITSTVEILDNELEAAKTSIIANTEEIDLRVKKDNVIGAINLTSETAKILASKINLVGAVTISALDSNLNDTISNASSNATTALNNSNTAIDAANAARDTAINLCPFVTGTQTAVTGAWTGVAPFNSLTDGQQITYWLPYAGNGNATLNLTLGNGTTTGAINCYYGGTTRLTTHYPAGSAIRLTYRSSVAINGTNYSGWWADANYDSGNTYDRTRFAAPIKAESDIAVGNIIVGNSNGYHNLKTGESFDVSYPILWAGLAMTAGSTGYNNYIIIPCGIAATQSLTLTAYKSLYIKGTLSGSTFTPISTAPITQTIPTTDDGYYYILLGTAYSTTAFYLLGEHPIFKFIDGSFQQIGVGANNQAQGIIDNIYTTGTTTIDGGKITTDSITSDAIAANAITTAKLATDSIKSLNYVADTSGSYLNLSNGAFDSKNFKFDSEGNVNASNISITGGNIDLLAHNYSESRVIVRMASGKLKSEIRPFGLFAQSSITKNVTDVTLSAFSRGLSIRTNDTTVVSLISVPTLGGELTLQSEDGTPPVTLWSYGGTGGVNAGNVQTTEGADLNDIHDSLTQKTSGKFVLPNGLKMCWGNFSPVNANGYVRQQAISFPVTFTSTPQVFVTKYDDTNNITMCRVTVAVGSITTSTVILKVMDDGGNIASSSVRVNWLAIGY